MPLPEFRESTATIAKKNDRIRAATPAEINARIDKDTEMRVWWHATRSRDDLAKRQQELDREPCIERVLSENVSLLALTGNLLGTPHASGKDVLLMLRRLHVRTTSEIEAERHALKVLEGYFAQVSQTADVGEAALAAR